MSQITRRSISSDKQYKQAFTIAVVFGIVINVIDLTQTDGRSLTLQTILIGGGFSLLYLFLGINDYSTITADKLDVFGEDVEALVNKAINEAKDKAKIF